jgi:hypothetical protein
MALELIDQTIAWVGLFGAQREYEDVRLSGCTLKGCRLVQADDPGLSLVVRNVVIDRCRMEGCVAAGVYFEDVTVDTLQLARPHLLGGCVFKHVTLRGKVGPVMAIPPRKPEFAAIIVERYKEIDWALDISEAIFSDADFYYVPGELIRRDETPRCCYGARPSVTLTREGFPEMPESGLADSSRRLLTRSWGSPPRALRISGRLWRISNGSTARALPDNNCGMRVLARVGNLKYSLSVADPPVAIPSPWKPAAARHTRRSRSRQVAKANGPRGRS